MAAYSHTAITVMSSQQSSSAAAHRQALHGVVSVGSFVNAWLKQATDSASHCARESDTNFLGWVSSYLASAFIILGSNSM